MTKLISSLLLATGMILSSASSATVINGMIGNMDGDKDGVTDLKISRVMFNVTAGTTVFFDSLVYESTHTDLNGDGKITGFDNYMLLLSGRTLLASNDDSGETSADGSVHGFDSTLRYTFASAGTYLVTLGQLAYGVDSALQGFNANRTFSPYVGSESFGAWRLTMTATNGILSNVNEVGVSEVPEPASVALLGLGLLGAAAARRKSKKAACV